MRKMLLPVLSSGYSVRTDDSIISIKLEGGFSRSRVDFLNATYSVNVKWSCNRHQAEYLNAFWRTATKKGVLPFLCNLVLDGGFIEEYTCKFVPGSFTPISDTSAFSIIANATLEVKPNVRTEALDNAILDTFESTGGSYNILEELNELANETMPDNLQ